jgi:hypothetical protein
MRFGSGVLVQTKSVLRLVGDGVFMAEKHTYTTVYKRPK